MLTLHQFAASHFNEKVRWALDYKAIDHVRESYLPGPHTPVIRKLSGGPSTTPLLQHPDGFISGSAAIIDWLEQTSPEPALYPADKDSRKAALAVQTRFDAEIGPATRTAVFSVFLEELGCLCTTFARDKPLWKRLAYRAVLPLARPMIRAGNNVWPESIERSMQITHDILDEVAQTTRATGYLVGDKFTIADLTAASLLAPIASVDHPDMKRPEPVPCSLREFLAQWQHHDGVSWVHQMYARHRRSR